MSKELIIRGENTHIDIALLENSQLLEYTITQTDVESFDVGNIYLAKVRKIIPGLNAAFVNLGYEKDAFLHYHDLGPQFSSMSNFLEQILTKKNTSFDKQPRLPLIDKNGGIADVITAGQYILVQIAKEPISTKGPRLSAEISIAGRNMVLIPFAEKISISQKIESNEEKNRLRKIVRSFTPENYGVIIRTAAEGATALEIELEIKELLQKWHDAVELIRDSKKQAPYLLLTEMSKVSALLRDIFTPDFNNIITNDAALCKDIREYIRTIAPEQLGIVKHYTAGPPIFEQFGVEKQIKSSFSRVVPLKNGAYIIIEKTEALHVIDVNSGNRTKSDQNQESNAFEVNCMAAIEIARQIRLRDLGGIIIIDFIDMRTSENRTNLLKTIEEAMSQDRARHNILPLTKFGLMQITRQRVRPEQNINTSDVCPACNGTGKIIPSINLIAQIEDRLIETRKQVPNGKIVLHVHPIIAGYLSKGFFSTLLYWKLKYCRHLKIVQRSDFNFLDYQFTDTHNNLIEL
ncbi:MAG: Rne/Rng family ribonuclease [Bacteroidales bacterium]|nr:Rne/Rng family ribonuclease [Bacteroidales bacterium]